MCISRSSRSGLDCLKHFNYMKRRFCFLYYIYILLSLAACGVGGTCLAQTASSLFRVADNVQVGEIVSSGADMYNEVGHHGPAVENQYMALRLYFNDSGAIDVYSKSGRGLELMKYGWYPDSLAVADDGAGYDYYVVDGTLGLGGIALWDGDKVVRLSATGGRTARAGDTSNGSFAEMIAYGVPYGDGHVDIMIRIDVSRKVRTARVTAKCLNGKKVSFVTGVNYHDGEAVEFSDGYIYTWGVHPVDTAFEPVPVGAGLFFSKGVFSAPEKTGDMVMIISKPCTQISTRIVAGSTREAELNSRKRFSSFMTK